jgi:hypothetical protein
MGAITFHWMNLFIPLVVFAPYALWLLLPSAIKTSGEKNKTPILWTFLENVGRVCVTIVPVFYPIVLDGEFSRVCVNGMLFLAVFYFAGWYRYFRSGREHAFLYLPMWKIPIPLAISPVLYFLLSAGLLQSIPMLVAALLLGFGHIPISYQAYQRTKPGL